jgi:hypothetical protein
VKEEEEEGRHCLHQALMTFALQLKVRVFVRELSS